MYSGCTADSVATTNRVPTRTASAPRDQARSTSGARADAAGGDDGHVDCLPHRGHELAEHRAPHMPACLDALCDDVPTPASTAALASSTEPICHPTMDPVSTSATSGHPQKSSTTGTRSTTHRNSSVWRNSRISVTPTGSFVSDETASRSRVAGRGRMPTERQHAALQPRTRRPPSRASRTRPIPACCSGSRHPTSVQKRLLTCLPARPGGSTRAAPRVDHRAASRPRPPGQRAAARRQQGRSDCHSTATVSP